MKPNQEFVKLLLLVRKLSCKAIASVNPLRAKSLLMMGKSRTEKKKSIAIVDRCYHRQLPATDYWSSKTKLVHRFIWSRDLMNTWIQVLMLPLTFPPLLKTNALAISRHY